MKDISANAASVLEDPEQWPRTLYWVCVAFALALGLSGTIVVPQYGEMFGNLRSGLRAKTIFALEYSNYLWLFFGAAAALGYARAKSSFPAARIHQLTYALFFAELGAFLFLCDAIYGNVFHLTAIGK